MSKKVRIYNKNKEIDQEFPSMAEAARVLDVDVSSIHKARKTGQWVFATGMAVKVRTI